MPDLHERLRIQPSRSSGRREPSGPLLRRCPLRAHRHGRVEPLEVRNLDRNGELLAGSAQRFATLRSRGAPSRAELTDAQSDEAIDVMRAHYDAGGPVYGSYSGISRTSYTAWALAIANGLRPISKATDPVWSGLYGEELALLLQRDLPFLAWQVEQLPRLQAVVCADDQDGNGEVESDLAPLAGSCHSGALSNWRTELARSSAAEGEPFEAGETDLAPD